jgi:hypothetical protein
MAGMITISRLQFTETLLTRITETITAEPTISRRKLSTQICQWMEWRSPNGSLKEMSCRKALLELHRRKLIELPECKKDLPFHTRNKSRPPACPPPFPVACSLEELGPVELIPIRSATSKNSRIWNSLLDSYHYLSSGPLCGAQLRYLVWSVRFGPLGGLSFSASAWRVRCRDSYISWADEARGHNQQLVVNNSRFLILPMVKVPDLASHVLAQCSKRLADDWQERYSYRPALLETFVDRSRFAGTCYRAANWQHVGTTTGRGRQNAGTTTKDVYLYPLSADWQEVLCSLPDGTLSTTPQPTQSEPADWTEEEFGGALLGDRRLTERLMQLGGAFFAKPTANIPQACSTKAGTKAAYRFFDNDRISMDTILAPHFEATEQRARGHEVVLAAQDTSTLNYSSHPMTEGLGPINTKQDKSIGMLLHGTMAFTPKGTPLGLLNVQCWARDAAEIGKRDQRHSKTIDKKESFKWIEGYHAVCAAQARSPKTQYIVMADREADIHELFVEYVQTPKSAELLIRAERSRNRNVIDEEDEIQRLWPCLESVKPAGIIDLLVPPQPDRPSRHAKLEIRFAPVTLNAPRRKAEMPNVPVHAVFAKEIDAPAGVDAPLEWMLLSTVPVTSFEDAQTALARYAKRWGIEIFHRVLKSGCRIEDRQLGSARRLENCLAIDVVVAWRIQHLTWLGRETPDLPCTVFFEDEEWKALVGFINQTPVAPATPPTLRQAMIMVATLGGFLNRKSDGEPGTETIWRGLQRLDDITRSYVAFVLGPRKAKDTATVSSHSAYG